MLRIKKKEIVSLDIFTFSCDGCGKCVRHCQRNVFKLINNGYCKYAIVRFKEQCNGCEKCLKVCLKNAIQLIIKEAPFTVIQ